MANEIRQIKVGLSKNEKEAMRQDILENVNVDLTAYKNSIDSKIEGIGMLHTSGTASSIEISQFTEDKGIYVATDTGEWYYFDAAQGSYVSGGDFVATGLILANSIDEDKLSEELQNKVNNIVDLGSLESLKVLGQKIYNDFEDVYKNVKNALFIGRINGNKDYFYGQYDYNNEIFIVNVGVEKYKIKCSDVLEENEISNFSSYTKVESDGKFEGKVDKVEDKQLSTNDFTNELKTKLDDIEPNANNYVLPDEAVLDLAYVHTDNNLTAELLAKINSSLQTHLSKSDILSLVGNATNNSVGFMSAEDKSNLETLVNSFKNDDNDNVVNTIKEILEIFDSYPEGATILSKLSTKVDKIEGSSLLSDEVKESYDLHLSNRFNPHMVDKVQVGLGNVDNTSDANKPVSAAQTIAISQAKNEAVEFATSDATDKSTSALNSAKSYANENFYAKNQTYNRTEIENHVSESLNPVKNDVLELQQALSDIADVWEEI